MTQQGRDRSHVAASLAAAGLTLPDVTPPLASYRPAVRTPDTIYTAGQLPFENGVLTAVGHLGSGGLTVEVGAAAAGRAALAAIAAAFGVVAEPELIRPVKVTVFIAVAPGFTDLPEVADGASEVFSDAFAVPHARSAVGVAELPRGAAVEVEAIFAVAGLG
jgi:enamine deaminase RidA (YjgF/YER057c/UK114 family)